MTTKQPLPDTITIGIEDYQEKLNEAVADLEGSNTTVESIIERCVDFAKLHMSEQWIEYVLLKEFNKFLDELRDDTRKVSCMVKLVDVVTKLTKYIEYELINLRLMDPENYVPYRLLSMLGNNSIVLTFRTAPITDLENPDSKRFDTLE